ncbi:MAG: hypothetical protein LBQ69_00710 [Treponema sp.]|jgi:hypothetical protein|nr:hypothetical protein [Treponema sp.]
MEDNNIAGEEPQADNEPKKGEKARRWIFSGFVRKGIRFSLALSLVIFALYLAGSMPDPGFPDRLLFLLLRMLRFASLVSCAFSLFALGFSVRRLVYHPGLRNFLGMGFYFAASLLSAGLAMLDSLIVAATGGNV